MKLCLYCDTIYSMKIIHTADIHLDSPLVGVRDPALRRHELLLALDKLFRYADANNVSAVIIAGDLFDVNFVTEQTVRSVADIFAHSNAAIAVLKGNHGGSASYELLRQLCPQVGFFGEEWTSFKLGNVTVCGRELGVNDDEQWDRLSLDPMRYNIVVLHGDVDDDSYGRINGRVLANSGAKYVALGHRHAFCEHRFGLVRACYSGALEPRGFDESADTGFVEIDTDSDQIRFVRQAIRSVVTRVVNVDGIDSDVALRRAVTDATADVSSENYLNVVFRGELCGGLHAELVAKQALTGRYFALRIADLTVPRVDLQSIMQEVSLRGEFVKLATGIEDEKLRSEVLKMGLAALNGEDLT